MPITILTTRTGTISVICLLISLFAAAVQPAWAESEDVTATKPRLVVLTDIGTEPDDAQSMVRLLTYANEFDIEGLIAGTSRHLIGETHPELIEERVQAYGQVLERLRRHASGYPDTEQLLKVIRSGSEAYGMAGVGRNKGSPGSQLLIEAVDKEDPRPLWVLVWGGASSLAQALWTVRETRSPEQVKAFVAKLRVYTISDQDDASVWARTEFPRLFWITSVHGFTQYRLATWLGMTVRTPGADSQLLSPGWLNEHIRSHGVLGGRYPSAVFGVEGDTPSFLYLIPNGLGHAEHPGWGSWGGRYGKPADFVGLWTNVADTVTGIDGNRHMGNQETVWRWRQAVQHDFAARMDWSITNDYHEANHPPLAILNNRTGSEPVYLTACAGDPVELNAAGTHDPDGDRVSIHWWHYAEATEGFFARSSDVFTAHVELKESRDNAVTVIVHPWLQPADRPLPPVYDVHIIMEATDSGTPALTRYRRAVISIPTGKGTVGKGCQPIQYAPRGTPWYKRNDPIQGPDSGLGLMTPIGVLLDHPEARKVLEQFAPEIVNGSSPALRDLTLRGVASFVPRLSDTVLEEIERALARLDRSS